MSRRLLLVHAHPDDETINTGATMARYAAEGVTVTLVTCTRGEQGEVIPPSLAHLAGSGDGLGDHRVGELSAAMTALGVSDHRFLGDDSAPGRTAGAALAGGGVVFRDSGMAYDAAGDVIPFPEPVPGAFALTPVETAAEALASVLLSVRPHVVVSYEPGGGYGHPDHVQAHRVTTAAVDRAAAGGWAVPKVYWSVQPESLMRAALEMMSVAGAPGAAPGGRLPSMVVPDAMVTTAIDASEFLPAKVAALRAHATQISVTDDDAFFALSNGVQQPIMGLEFYRLVRGTLGDHRDDVNRETELF
jgi:N-acetyl-1-D-myo-inositol-2-amino-2-deoxy-alpha-D-glucopyranoside deacetylase